VCCSVLQCAAISSVCSQLHLLYFLWYHSVNRSVLQCVAVCCSALQCVAVCFSVLQCVAVCCSVLQCVAVCCSVHVDIAAQSTRHYIYCIPVLQCVAVCCSVLQCVAAQSTSHYMCCSVLQCVAVCCSTVYPPLYNKYSANCRNISLSHTFFSSSHYPAKLSKCSALPHLLHTFTAYNNCKAAMHFVKWLHVWLLRHFFPSQPLSRQTVEIKHPSARLYRATVMVEILKSQLATP